MGTQGLESRISAIKDYSR